LYRAIALFHTATAPLTCVRRTTGSRDAQPSLARIVLCVIASRYLSFIHTQFMHEYIISRWLFAVPEEPSYSQSCLSRLRNRWRPEVSTVHQTQPWAESQRDRKQRDSATHAVNTPPLPFLAAAEFFFCCCRSCSRCRGADTAPKISFGISSKKSDKRQANSRPIRDLPPISTGSLP
jgi:hypothetical protein